MKKKKGFTLIELLVVISIIAMLLAILMPALGKVKKLAQRLVCGTNVKGLGNATYVYANDYDDDFPIAGGKGDTSQTPPVPTQWGTGTAAWSNNNVQDRATASVSASLYLLIREADVGTKSYNCTGADETPFESDADITELYDFSSTPQKYQSYSYQLPYVNSGAPKNYYPVSGTSNSSNAVLADKNPRYDESLTYAAGTADNWTENCFSIDMNAADSHWTKQRGNASAHDRAGQNVMFVDGHVAFEKSPDVGTRDDNIYTQASGGSTPEANRRVGKPVKYTIGGNVPMTSIDSFLVNDEECQ